MAGRIVDWLGAVALGIAVMLAAAEAGAQTPPPSAAAFAEPPGFHDISLSPSGRQIAKIVQRDSLFYIEVWQIGGTAPSASFDFGPARAPTWIEWKNEQRLLVSIGVPSERYGFLLNETRLISFRSDLTRPVMMNALRGRNADPPFQDGVIDMMPNDPNGVLVEIGYESGSHPELYRADVQTGRLTRIRENNPEVVGWMLDSTGRAVYGLGDPFRQRDTLYRTREGDWQVDPVPLPAIGEGGVFQPVALDGSNDRLVVRSNHEGGTTGLYIYDLTQSAFVQTLFKHERFDVSGPVMSPAGDRVVGAAYVGDTFHVVYSDPAAEARADAIGDLIGSEEVWIVEQTRDGRYVIAVSYEDGRPADTHWVDTSTSEIQLIDRSRSGLGGYRRSPVHAVTYAARDGLDIPGYITLPPGVTLETARGLPFVVMPHGGPHARDTAEFDFLAQFVASRGYGVLQPNFRGSTGFGEAFRQAGEREWGGAILNDIEDGARWITTQGYADASRMCVVGWSFGGYVALMSAVQHEELFQCASATAPVSDLPTIIRHQERFYGGDQVMRRMIGNAWRDRARLAAESPLRRAAEVEMPVLLVHGTIDDRVPISHSTDMASALREAGKPVTYLSLDWADHSLTRQGDRQRFLTALEGFLAEHIGQAGSQNAAEGATGASAPAASAD